MRALLLGAGASARGGYPLTRDLLSVLAEEAQGVANETFKQAWEKWVAWRDAVPDSLALVARNANPEVVLSLPDLMALAAETEDDARLRSATRKHNEGDENATHGLEQYHDSPERDALAEAKVARGHLIHCLESYFEFAHGRDAQKPRSSRDYLRRALGKLRRGDVVVTLNWDTLAERTLAEDGLWNPVDGYGFERPLVWSHPEGVCQLPPQCSGPSPVQVLKLHGSVGWRRSHSGFYLQTDGFLSEFLFPCDDAELSVADPEETPLSFSEEVILAYPSFLKQLRSEPLQTVWHKTLRCFASAECIDVWGYSLPPDDSAVRTLLLSVVTRVREGDCWVTVHDPNSQVLDRWKELFGSRVTLVPERL